MCVCAPGEMTSAFKGQPGPGTEIAQSFPCCTHASSRVQSPHGQDQAPQAAVPAARRVAGCHQGRLLLPSVPCRRAAGTVSLPPRQLSQSAEVTRSVSRHKQPEKEGRSPALIIQSGCGAWSAWSHSARLPPRSASPIPPPQSRASRPLSPSPAGAADGFDFTAGTHTHSRNVWGLASRRARKRAVLTRHSWLWGGRAGPDIPAIILILGSAGQGWGKGLGTGHSAASCSPSSPCNPGRSPRD